MRIRKIYFSLNLDKAMKLTVKKMFMVYGLVCCITACDVVKGPKVDPNGFTGTTNKVLIEDFTGQMCGNCPNAHRAAETLKETYGENLVLIAVHSTNFAVPVPALGFPTDFRTPMGDELATFYDAANLGLPVGLVNRRQWGGTAATRYPNWGTYVAAVLEESPKLVITLTPAYQSDTRKLDVTAKLEYTTEGDANHHIVAVVIEDSVISKQYDFAMPVQDVEEYEQNHVLRMSITPGTWGVPVKNGKIFLGEKLQHRFTATLDTDWRAEKCAVVVYVMDNTTKEILQVEQVKVVE